MGYFFLVGSRWTWAHSFTLCVAAGSGAAASSSRNLWVSGLSSTTRATDLKTLFSKYGKVGKYGNVSLSFYQILSLKAPVFDLKLNIFIFLLPD